MTRAILRLALLASLAGCATLAPSVEGVYVSPAAPALAPSAAPPALVLIGDIGIDRGPHSERIARAVARELRAAPGAPVVVLGDVFYMIGLVGNCGDEPVSRRGCERPGRPEDQFERVMAHYRAALPENPLIAIPGNHDFYGGQAAVENTCRLMPRAGAGSRYVARGCGLDDRQAVELLDLGSIAILLLDSEPMIREPEWLEHSLGAMRVELERLRAERPETAILVATHHPLETHGSHNGGSFSAGVIKDFRFVFGALLFPIVWPIQNVFGQQDPYQRHYRAYRRGLYRLFRDYPILAFVSGHDHSLQHVGIDHPGVRHQLVSGSGTNRSPVKRMGLDWMFSGRVARAVGLRDVLPAPRHRLLFGIGGESQPEGLSGWGFATLTPVEGGLQVEFFDAVREEPIYSALLSSTGAAGSASPPARD